MTEHYIIAALLFLVLAIPTIQHMRVRKLIPQFKNLEEAISASQVKLDAATSELQGLQNQFQQRTAELAAQDAEGLLRERAAALKVSQLTATIKELDESIVTAKASYIRVSNEVTQTRSDLAEHQAALGKAASNLAEIKQRVAQEENRLEQLLTLEKRESSLLKDIQSQEIRLQAEVSKFAQNKGQIENEISLLNQKRTDLNTQVAQLMSKIDLYSRLDEYTRVGHFEMPQYLYDTSVRYQSEIKEIREQQKKLIREKKAVTYPEDFMICTEKFLNKRILDGQAALMLSAFNIDCDLLIEKVSPSNLDRTLEQIEKKAEQLEKNCATLRCGFNIDYVELKFEECKLQFEYTLKKQEEQEEQRLIREQMKEEVRVQKQYEEAMKEAEKEELKYRRLIERAREHLNQENEQERALSLAKISLLEEQLREAEERGIRAKSMAEQTRRGFVYVISNVGAFGEGVYKIGLTRRLDPQERVDELGDASVPFPFDVHAMCFSEDAPALEHALHKKFANRRVNCVNFRKEFFRVDLPEIQDAIEELVNDEVEFKVTAQARDYYESKRLLSA
jgi:hypothetical protein